MFNPQNLADRMHLVDAAENSGEKGRKYESFKQWEIYSDRIRDYVENKLREQYDLETVREMPVQSSINLAKRLVNQEAVVYKEEPVRVFEDLTDEQQEQVNSVYDEMRVDKKLSYSNKGYKLQDQSTLMVVPRESRLELRVFKNHQVTVIPDSRNPEKAAAYIVTSFNKQDFVDQSNDNNMTATGYRGKVDQFDSSKEAQERNQANESDENKNYIVWTKDFNWSMNKQGDLTSDIFPNPLSEFGLLPFVDISIEKEFEYWVRQGSDVTDATVEFNANVLTDVANTIKHQAFAQAVLKGPEKMLMENVRIGPTYLLKLIVDPQEGIESDFEYKNTGADISGSLEWINTWLSLYLTSKGMNPEVVTASGQQQMATSGLDRLLQMIQQLSASSEDFEVYARAEQQLWNVIRAWLIVLSDTEMEEEFSISGLPEKSKVSVKYSKPDMIQSVAETLSNASKRIEMGVSSPIKELMDMHGIDRDKAEEMFSQFQDDNERFLTGRGLTDGEQEINNINQERNQADD